jgi:hypothetical protein
MITSRRDFLAANPWGEEIFAPLDLRIFTHHKSPQLIFGASELSPPAALDQILYKFGFGAITQ